MNIKLVKRQLHRVIALVLALAFVTMDIPGSSAYAAQDKELTLDAAISAAKALNPDMEQLEINYRAKAAAKQSALKSIAVKKKKMSTMSWSPLFSIKWPTQANQGEAYEFTFKPISIQNDMNLIKHEMNSANLEVTEKVSKYFVDIDILDKQLAFNEKRKTALEKGITANEARLVTGEAKQGDIDSMKKSLETINKSIAADTKSKMNLLTKLGKAIGMDVSTGYTLSNPLVEAEIPRDALQDLIDYTLDNDHTYYTYKMDKALKRVSLETYANLNKGNYKTKDYNKVAPFVNAALNEQDFSKNAFDLAYNDYLKSIDDPWQGKFRILFFKFPKVWKKDEKTDGINYVDDDPKALYTAALEYVSASKEEANYREELIENIKDQYEGYQTVRQAYLTSTENVEKLEKQLEKAVILNSAGEMDYDSYKSVADEYEAAELDMIKNLGSYSETLYAFDKATCGAVSRFLFGTDVTARSADAGLSYVEDETDDGAYYYLEYYVEDSQFWLHVYFPPDFPVSVTHFELWVQNSTNPVQIGERTSVTKELRHMGVDLSSATRVFIRLYNGDKFVDDCTINPSFYNGRLKVVKDRKVVKAPDKEIGTFTSTTAAKGGFVTVKFKVNEDLKATYYKIKYKTESGEYKYLGDGSMIPIDKGFTYLPIVENGIDDLTLELYDDNAVKTEGYLNLTNLTIYMVSE